jgi:hypothetical protein
VTRSGGDRARLSRQDFANEVFDPLADLVADRSDMVLRAEAGLTRYGALAVAFVVGAVLPIVIAEKLEAPEHV